MLFGIIYLSTDILKAYSNGEESKNIRSTILMLTALLGVSGIPLFIWRTNIAQSQASTARDRAYTELFTKAIEQLGAEKPAKKVIMGEDQTPTTVDDYVPNIEVRIGAIYALERIMKDSEKDAPAIVDTLAAYVRENCGEPKLECKIPQHNEYKTTSEWIRSIKLYVGNPWRPIEGSLVSRARELSKQSQVNRADIKTALEIIGNRPKWLKDPKLFRYRVTKSPDLRNVNFQGWDLSHFDLSHCDLRGANMQGTILQNTKFQSANMAFAKLQGSNCESAKMHKVNFQLACLQGAILSSAILNGALLDSSELQCADLSFTDFEEEATLINLQMQGAILKGITFNEAIFYHNNIQETVLDKASFQNVMIGSCKINACSMHGTDLSKIDFEFEELKRQLHDTFGHKVNTILPEGMEPPEHWSNTNTNTSEGFIQYQREWEAFKKKMGVE